MVIPKVDLLLIENDFVSYIVPTYNLYHFIYLIYAYISTIGVWLDPYRTYKHICRIQLMSLAI